MPIEHTINLDYGLGSDIDMLRDSVRGFASETIAPRAAEIDEKDTGQSGERVRDNGVRF
jgi:isovaleryl-CoA dehydrogenase